MQSPSQFSPVIMIVTLNQKIIFHQAEYVNGRTQKFLLILQLLLITPLIKHYIQLTSEIIGNQKKQLSLFRTMK